MEKWQCFIKLYEIKAKTQNQHLYNTFVYIPTNEPIKQKYKIVD